MSNRVDFRYVQKEPSVDGSFDICYTYVFFINFIDHRTQKKCRLKYVARAEVIDDAIAVKFYASRDRKSPHNKYSLAHGQLGAGAVLQIFNYCLKIIIEMIGLYPEHSFVVKAAEAFDPRTRRLEDENENQRFRIYRSFLAKKIGTASFSHYQFPENSIYLLLRKKPDMRPGDEQHLMNSLYNRFGL